MFHACSIVLLSIQGHILELVSAQKAPAFLLTLHFCLLSGVLFPQLLQAVLLFCSTKWGPKISVVENKIRLKHRDTIVGTFKNKKKAPGWLLFTLQLIAA